MRGAWLVLLAACSPFGDGALELARVEPPMGGTADIVPVRVEGDNFHHPITSNVDNGMTDVGALAVLIGEVPLVDAVIRDPQVIEGAVPAGMPIGTYDVTVQIGDRTDVLPAGYRVFNARVRPPAGPCGRPGVLADDFADGVAAPAWVVESPANVTEANGQLEITPASAASSAGYRSNPYVNLTGAAAEVEVRSVPTTAGAGALFQLAGPTGRLAMLASGGELLADGDGNVKSVPYDPVAHRIWRIEHTGPEVRFMVSPDGLAWTALHSIPAPAFIDAVSIYLMATAAATGGAAAGTVTFAEMSTYVAPSTWCPSLALTDGFNDNVIGRGWAYHGRTSAGCAESESGTAAHVDQNGAQACDAYFASSALYSLADSEVVTRITAITTYTTGWITYVSVTDLAGQTLRLYFEQNMMCVDGTGVAKQCESYATTEDLWRIRESGGTVYFEMSAGGASWRVVGTTPAPFPVDAVRVQFGTATDRAIGMGIGLSVDRVN